MPLSSTVAQAYAETYSVSELTDIRTAALQAYSNSMEVSISFEGSSITVDKSNAESILETVQEALRIKAVKAAGCDPDLHGPSSAVVHDRRYHNIR